MSSYQDLDVWSRALDLVEEVYQATDSLPDREKFGLTSQIRRAAVSIPSNIAEGKGQGSDRSFIRFLSIAKGSLMELETQLMIAQRLSYLSKNELDHILNECQEIGKMISGLQKALDSQ